MKSKDLFQYTLGAMIVIGFFVFLFVLSIIKIPQDNKDILNIVVGSLIAAFATIVGYFYGSSSSSSKKDDTIGSMIQQNIPPTDQLTPPTL